VGGTITHHKDYPPSKKRTRSRKRLNVPGCFFANDRSESVVHRLSFLKTAFTELKKSGFSIASDGQRHKTQA
jgi:hypothetical protein